MSKYVDQVVKASKSKDDVTAKAKASAKLAASDLKGQIAALEGEIVGAEIALDQAKDAVNAQLATMPFSLSSYDDAIEDCENCESVLKSLNDVLNERKELMAIFVD